MDAREVRRLDAELNEYLGHFVEGLGRTERRDALRLYMTGLLLDGERKSVEPMAQRLVSDASHAEAMRQRLQQAVSIADWGNEVMLSRLAKKLDRELPGVEAFVIDDTGFGKKGNQARLSSPRNAMRRGSRFPRSSTGAFSPGAIYRGPCRWSDASCSKACCEDSETARCA